MTTVIDASETETNGVTTEAKKPRASKRPPWTAPVAAPPAEQGESATLANERAALTARAEARRHVLVRELSELDVAFPEIAGAQQPAAPSPRKPRASKPAPGRLPRRSSEDITAAATKVIELVKKAGKSGLRSEQIRAALKLDKREMPGVLKACLEVGALKTRGQKRATTYYAR